jgi:hypothetical protein
MQRRCEIEIRSRAWLVTDERSIESSALNSTGCHGLTRRSEANGLITKGREGVLMPQQARPIRLKHQHRLAKTTKRAVRVDFARSQAFASRGRRSQ